MPTNTAVYFFDGASRAPRANDDARKASFGALLRYNGVVQARIAVRVGDKTNNEAEYLGVLEVLRHAENSRFDRICVYGDSKLVISQLNGEWKCKAAHLAPLYETGLQIIRRLHGACSDGLFRLSHVYREYNADADSLANVALDNPPVHRNVVVDDTWTTTHDGRG